MDREWLYKKAKEFDSDKSKIQYLEWFLLNYEMAYAELRRGGDGELALTMALDRSNKRYLEGESQQKQIGLHTIEESVLIMRFFLAVDMIYITVPDINLLELKSYGKILDFLDRTNNIDLITRYTYSEKKRVSSELNLMDYDYSSVKKNQKNDLEEIRTIDDIVKLVKVKLSSAYWIIIESPKNLVKIKKTTFEYTELIKELIGKNYNGKNLREYFIDTDSASLKTNELFSVILSPESIFVIMNNYRKAEDKESAMLLLLKIAYSQSVFIFDKKISFQLDELEAEEYCERICDRLEDYKKCLDNKLAVIPSIPFYNYDFFARRVGKDDISEAKLIERIDFDNEMSRYDDSIDFNIFADVVSASSVENRLKQGMPINTSFDIDVYAVALTYFEGSYPDDVDEFVRQFNNNQKSKYESISCTLKYYLLGIYLGTLYMLADSIKIKDGNFPFKRCRDNIQYLLFDQKSYYKAIEVFGRYGLDNMNTVEEKAYSSIKDRMLVLLKNALDGGESFDDIIRNDAKMLYSQYALWLGQDDYFLNLIEEICEKIRKRLELLVEKEPEYKDFFDDLIQKYTEQMKNVENGINAYSTDCITQDEVKRTISSLATGEFLYQRYIAVNNPPQMDFSCIALEYYTALESLVNIIFYTPYREEVLVRKGREIKEEDKKEEKLNGYIGESTWDRIFNKEMEPKPSLELGTISFLYRILKKGTVETKAVKVADYLIALNLDIKKVNDIFKKIRKVAELRNEAAHAGDPLPCKKAKIAQDVAYVHEPNPDPEINNDEKRVAADCHNLIGEIFSLFSE